MPVSFRGRLSTGRTLWYSSKVMMKGGVGDTVALGRVGSGLTAGVAMEDDSDLGFLASGVASRSPYSTPSLPS